MSSRGIYLINLLIIPIVIFAYHSAILSTASLQLNSIYFYLFLFLFIHMGSSALIILSNYLEYGEIKTSLAVAGIGPTIVSILVLLVITILPFLKWPMYIFSGLPSFDLWVNPLIMGFFAYFIQIIISKSISASIFEIGGDPHNPILLKKV